ncbi:MAG: diguanylate cyclase [Gammaproteobacteria bacterium]|nr:diguanylate cyclase [Gammaproteobacteria bacterium]
MLKRLSSAIRTPFVISILAFVSGVMVVSSVSYFGALTEHDTYLKSVKEVQTQKVFDAQVALDQLALLSFQSMIFNNDVIGIMAKAAQGSSSEQDLARKQLYSQLYAKYQLLKKHRVRQLHFHLPDAVSFLRFHRPDKFGDSLLSVRESLRLVNEQKYALKGFEEGRVYNGFRHVYPLFYFGQFVGSVEISYGFDAISHLIGHSKPAKELFFVNRQSALSSVFEAERAQYHVSDLGHNWLLDETGMGTLDKKNSLIDETIKRINANLSDTFLDKLSAQGTCTGCTLSTQLKTKYYTVSFVPIFNFKDRQVAFIALYEQDTVLPLIYQNVFNQFILMVLFTLLLSIGLYFYLKNHLMKVEEIEHLASHDLLTGLYNRVEIEKRLPILLAKRAKAEGSVSVIFFDVDHFKHFNDEYGHLIGDEVLKDLAHVVEGMLDDNSLFTRWGGEEFLIVLPNTNQTEATHLAIALCHAVNQHAFTQKKLSVTCSFGVLEQTDEYSPNRVLDAVDILLYQAKEQGRNRVVSKTLSVPCNAN